ncbi:hypothetical protein J437_LFUL011809 [Ladona fulva]|uniref:Retroviral polymerase SH3-like domain-containing protein n=1 Tax=Ladona fulva TaxID=123851 RepID=A0A8K0KC96_LADFU|nr:hypothetical protein J437_LFUL011809 [Ladona fulva]
MVVCYICKKPGHKAAKWWFKNKGNLKQGDGFQNHPSGASVHMCGNRELLSNYKVVEGKDFNRAGNEKLRTEGVCDNCVKAKQTRASFPRGRSERSKKILGIIHSDVCGPMDEVSLGGHKYFATFIDDKTRYTYVALLKSKDEVLEKIKLYKTIVEKQIVKFVKLTVGGTPEQNGVAERANRSILEKTRAMLKEAVAVKDQVPYEAWTGRRVNIGHLKVFECLAYVHVPKVKSNKLGDRGTAYIFVSYDEEKRGIG